MKNPTPAAYKAAIAKADEAERTALLLEATARIAEEYRQNIEAIRAGTKVHVKRQLIDGRPVADFPQVA